MGNGQIPASVSHYARPTVPIEKIYLTETPPPKNSKRKRSKRIFFVEIREFEKWFLGFHLREDGERIPAGLQITWLKGLFQRCAKPKPKPKPVPPKSGDPVPGLVGVYFS